MLTALERIADWLGWLASAAARILLIGVAASLILQVTLRYVFNTSLPWPEEAARYLMIWTVMLAGSVLVKDEQLVRVDFFDGFWPKRMLSIRNALFRLLLVGLLAVLVWKGWENAMFGLRRTAVTLQISFFWIYLSVPVGAALMMFHMLVLALRDLVRGTPDDGPSVLKAEV
ncbi:membrane protein [Salipiger pallidus]|uniref:TRAP transporter small permease protein n=1 Tax=Salipiger pallidus TaxID=1775170 RepID=A0A8J3EFL4_9RHOB|nr:TRAP transporter small permease [Salipiger pallidus]GGG64955.1 membrane protein [Salipiger pallidus]